jgi:adenylate kinase family enzyme
MPRRVVVMGPPGSGKSTLARRIGACYRLPVYHLDQAYWRSGWIAAPAAEFRAEVARLAALPAWVIDGNYIDTIGPRFAAADVVIYLDVAPWRSVVRIVRRALLGYGRVRPDAALGCPERLDLGFVRFAWTFRQLRHARNLALVASFPGHKTVVPNIAAAEAWLRSRA